MPNSVLKPENVLILLYKLLYILKKAKYLINSKKISRPINTKWAKFVIFLASKRPNLATLDCDYNPGVVVSSLASPCEYLEAVGKSIFPALSVSLSVCVCVCVCLFVCVCDCVCRCVRATVHVFCSLI